MRNNQATVQRRRQQILEMVLSAGEISVTEIAQAHKISDMTARRDLQYLEDQNLLWRIHGGANSIEHAQEMKLFREDIVLCRNKISEYAAQFVSNGDTLFINGSRTALNMLKYIKDKEVFVHTNNGAAISQNYPKGVTICFTGGELRNHVMVGERVMRYLLSISVKKIFIGCAAVYDDGEFRYDIPTEIGINESLISRKDNEIFVLADHSKLIKRITSQKNFYGSSTYDRHIKLITDENADKEFIEKLRERGMEILLVPINEDN